MSESNLFQGGVPTKPDVDKLREKFGVPKEGAVITWKQIEDVIGCKKGSSRFATVVDAWRKAMDREHQLIFGPVRGQGLKALPPDDRIELSSQKRKSGIRMVGRSFKIATFTDRNRLTPENQRVQDHILRSAAAIKLAVATAAKGIDLPSLEK